MTGTSARAEFAAGWSMLAASFLGLLVGISSLFFYTTGIFMKPLQAEFGWSRAELSSATLISGLTLACVSPFLGRLVDRIGVRPVIGVSMTLLALAAFAVSLVPNHLALYLAAIALVCLCGAGTSPVVFTRPIASRFVTARGLALGLLLSGTGLVGALAPALFTPWVAEHGWRAGYRLLAAIVLVAMPVVLLGMGGRKDGPAASAVQTTARAGSVAAAIRDRTFRIMLIAFLMISIAVGGLIVHFVPMLLDGGMGAAVAGRTAGLIGLAIIGGRVVTGALIDRLHAPYVAAALFVAAAAGCVALAYGGLPMAPVAAILIGFAMGAEVDLIGFLVARYLGLASYGAVYGILYGAFIAGASCGPYLVGLSFDRSGTYNPALVCAAILLATGAVLLARLGPYPEEAAP